jgi:ADP-ribose pyrophosphatase YjhB (NUDIX family)/NTP pyrophosphatase (non-canonical NTP hydrolase)
MNFCPNCATPLEPIRRGGRERPACPACGWVGFSPAPTGVAAVIQDAAGRVLLIRRRTAFRPGQWCLPCGYLEGDEELRAGLAREVREETGLEVAVGAVVAVHSNLDREPPYPVGVWLRATPVGGALLAGDDADAAEFFALDDLPAELAFATDRRVLDQLRAEATSRPVPDASVAELTAEMHAFVRSKGWYEPDSKRPQTPRNLAISLALEAAEVLEHVQWRDQTADPAAWQGELADVMLYLLQLADHSGVNLTAAVRATLRRNAGRVWDVEKEDKG